MLPLLQRSSQVLEGGEPHLGLALRQSSSHQRPRKLAQNMIWRLRIEKPALQHHLARGILEGMNGRHARAYILGRFDRPRRCRGAQVEQDRRRLRDVHRRLLGLRANREHLVAQRELRIGKPSFFSAEDQGNAAASRGIGESGDTLFWREDFAPFDFQSGRRAAGKNAAFERGLEIGRKLQFFQMRFGVDRQFLRRAERVGAGLRKNEVVVPEVGHQTRQRSEVVGRADLVHNDSQVFAEMSHSGEFSWLSLARIGILGR